MLFECPRSLSTRFPAINQCRHGRSFLDTNYSCFPYPPFFLALSWPAVGWTVLTSAPSVLPAARYKNMRMCQVLIYVTAGYSHSGIAGLQICVFLNDTSLWHRPSDSSGSAVPPILGFSYRASRMDTWMYAVLLSIGRRAYCRNIPVLLLLLVVDARAPNVYFYVRQIYKV